MSTRETSSTTSPNPPTKTLRSYACVLCTQRKVKCDRKTPCTTCVRDGVACVVKAPPPPRRKKRHINADTTLDVHDDQASRDRRGKQSRVNNAFDEPSRHRPRDEQVSPPRERNVGAKLLELNLWTGLESTFKDPREELGGIPIARSPTDWEHTLPTSPTFTIDALSVGANCACVDSTSLHPQPIHIFMLWQTFLDNVHPLSKLLHAPTVQSQITVAAQNLSTAPKGLVALIFAIYTAAAASLSDEDCTESLGESKSSLVTRFSSGARQALSDAHYLKSSDLRVLQALTLLLLATRRHYDPQALWILSGIAVRKAQMMNLHRYGTTMGLSAFESEIRSRLWWQIMILDSRSGQVCGSRSSSSMEYSDIKIPSNLNDADLYPDMKELPIERTGVTEMIFCLVRYEFGAFLMSSQGHGEKLNSPNVTMEEKDDIIQQLETKLENKFVRFCDPSITLHQLSVSVAQAVVCKMKLIAHHPRQYADKGAGMSEEERQMLLATSLKLVQYDCLGQTLEAMRRFQWHINAYFQLDAFVFMLSELRSQTLGALVDTAWDQVHELYRLRFDLITDTKNALYVAIGDLTLHAWTHREAQLGRQHSRKVETPWSISKLREMRVGTQRTQHITTQLSQTPSLAMGTTHPHTQQSREADAGALPDLRELGQDLDSSFAPMDFSLMDWDYWTDLLEQDERAAASQYD